MKSFKQFFDFILAFFLIFILLLPSIIIFIISSIDNKQNGLFVQNRLGKNKKVFKIYKFRTIQGIPKSTITTSEIKISKIGVFLRKYKLDEIPQLINILLGDMSFVGPRPDVPIVYDNLNSKYNIIFKVKPGITGPAQIKYKNEEETLNNQLDPIKYYFENIFPDKLEINFDYVNNWSLKNDFKYLLKTIC